MEDENQKLIDEIIVLSRLSSHRLREQTHRLIEIYQNQKKKTQKVQKNNSIFLKQIDKRSVVVQASSSKKDKLLSQQSKMATMGEMMDAVAHQWKQPLNSLSMMNDMLEDDFKDGVVDSNYIRDLTQTSQMQIAHMVNTLNEFRTFFRPSKENADFSVADCIQSVEILMKDELIKNNINLNIEIEDNLSIYGLTNEFKHLFLNLISNSIDAFNEKALKDTATHNIKNRTINIKTYIEKNKNIIDFSDNALGIPEHIIADIFKPNVTTKEDGKGTGIGLYMSSQIVKKHAGTISVINTDIGALFTITIKN
ncbi:HAMP domain-containing sensor histidine kinase [Sulfurimonas sp.]|uniref:sensor histidine kinase n=1 Tax=Sulfurimonas sp. TaxID=2022749 RepID=UPI002B4944BE|nr:HAMP domain-containing sensor histidine kinase [Sulfurimonas sp.]